MNKVLKRALPLALAICLLAYALKDIAFKDILNQFSKANYGFIALSATISIFIFYLRGLRWQQPLNALGYYPSAIRGAIALLAGTIAGMIVPGTGEVTRCLTLQRTDGVPFAQGVGSVVAERLPDLLMMPLTLLLAFVLEFNRMQAYLATVKVATPGTITAVILGIAIVGLGILYGLWQIPFVRQHSFTQRVLDFSKGLWQGFSAIGRLPNPGLYILLTLSMQGLAFLSTYFLMQSLDATRSLPPTAALTIMALSGLGALLIPTQGGVGTFHFVVSRALVLYGLSTAEGALVATFMHAVGFAINIVLSSLSFLIVPVLVQQRQERLRAEQES